MKACNDICSFVGTIFGTDGVKQRVITPLRLLPTTTTTTTTTSNSSNNKMDRPNYKEEKKWERGTKRTKAETDIDVKKRKTVSKIDVNDPSTAGGHIIQDQQTTSERDETKCQKEAHCPRTNSVRKGRDQMSNGSSLSTNKQRYKGKTQRSNRNSLSTNKFMIPSNEARTLQTMPQKPAEYSAKIQFSTACFGACFLRSVHYISL